MQLKIITATCYGFFHNVIFMLWSVSCI